MKKYLIAGAAAGLALQVQAADPKPLSSTKERASYAVGLNVGQRFKHDFIELDQDAFFRGFKDALSSAKPALTETELDAALEQMRKDVEVRVADNAAKNKKAGEEFLAKNKTEKGVVTTASGLQLQAIKEGDGPTPKATDTVKVNYRGTLIDGTEFDSSYKRGQPAVFPLNGVIPGWTEGVQKMKVGSKYKLVVPPALGYGEQGAPPTIPPNSTLIFEIELLSIEAPQE